MVVSVGVTVFVDLPLGSLVQRGVRCIRVGESAVQLGVTLATSDPVVGDANINNQITRSRRIREVNDDFEVPALQARALGDSLRLDLVSSSLEERAELTNHPIVRLGSTLVTFARANMVAVKV